MISVWLIDHSKSNQLLAVGLLKLDPHFVMIVGYLGLMFFGLAALYILVKLFYKRPGLIIDKDGIYDNSSAAAGNLIRWEQIEGLRIQQAMSTKFILVDLKDPQRFMNNVNGIKEKLMWSTYKMYGTTASISSSILNCDFDTLFQMLSERVQSDQNLL